VAEPREIHFYPKSKILVVFEIQRGAKIQLHAIDAWGGPDKPIPSGTMAATPTTAGRYIIEKTHAYSTPTWPMSRIKWGTQLRDMPDKNDVWYALPSGKWGSVKQLVGIERRDLRDLNQRLYGSQSVPSTWIFNDFGPVAIRYFKDSNGNGRLDGKETLMGEMIHTTPNDEAVTARGLAVSLVESHGCIHIRPQDRGKLIQANVFKPGTPFIVHDYSEAYSAPAAR
jgi:hypothetical protein